MRPWHAIIPAQKCRDANEQAKLRYMRNVTASRVAVPLPLSERDTNERT
jgi:hypothetical protein